MISGSGWWSRTGSQQPAEPIIEIVSEHHGTINIRSEELVMVIEFAADVDVTVGHLRFRINWQDDNSSTEWMSLGRESLISAIRREIVHKRRSQLLISAPAAQSSTDLSGSPSPQSKTFIINDGNPLPVALPVRPFPVGRVVLRDSARISPARLFIVGAAMRQIFGHIGWGATREANVVEQGGLLLGKGGVETSSGLIFSVIEKTISASEADGDPGYLRMNHVTWHKMLEKIDEMKAGLALDPAAGVVGWYHTHPNGLPVFMSCTDVSTQRTFFPHDWHFAVVLNPHTKQWRAFAGAEASPCGAVVLEDALPAAVIY